MSATAWCPRRRARLPPEQRKMSMIFQSYALWPHMTVAENIVYGLRLRKIDRADHRQKARRDPAQPPSSKSSPQRYPGELSGGQQQRVALARAPDRRAGNPAARRAAVQPRRQSARRDALRNPPAARRIPLHHGVRHPRPVRGDDHRRPDRGHERRQDRRSSARPRTSTTGRNRNSSRASSAPAM